MRFRPSLAVAATAALCLAAMPAPAAAQFDDRNHTLRLRAGIFEPDGDSQYWQESADLFTSSPEDFEDAVVGIDYRLGLGGRLGLLVSVSGYEGETVRHYLDFVDNFGGEIRHDAILEATAVTAGLMFHLAPTHAPIQPYVGAGGGLYDYTLTESGEFVDFADGSIFPATFLAEGNTFGYFFLAGLDVPITRNVALFAEGRWHRVEDELGDDFEGFGDLDLSGREISGGVAWRF